MQKSLFSLTLEAEKLFTNATNYYLENGSETNTLNGIPTFNQDTILELINNTLASNDNIQSLLASILGEANTGLINSIHISIVDSSTIFPYSYTGVSTEIISTSTTSAEWYTTPFSSYALGTSPTFQVTVKFDTSQVSPADADTVALLESLNDIGGYSFDAKLAIDLRNIIYSASGTSDNADSNYNSILNQLIANNCIVAVNAAGGKTLSKRKKKMK